MTPMCDIPDHFPIPVDADGNGPVFDVEETDHIACWCGRTDYYEVES